MLVHDKVKGLSDKMPDWLCLIICFVLLIGTMVIYAVLGILGSLSRMIELCTHSFCCFTDTICNKFDSWWS